MISGSRKRPERLKSAPPALAYEFLRKISTMTDWLTPLFLTFIMASPNPREVRRLSPAARLQDLIVDASSPEYINDDSSFGYDPSDDTSETSSAFYHDHGSYKKHSRNAIPPNVATAVPSYSDYLLIFLG